MFLAFFFFYFTPALFFLRRSSKRNFLFYLLTLSPLITSFFSLILLFLNLYNFFLVLLFNLIFTVLGIFKLKNLKITFKNYTIPFIFLALILPFFTIQGEPFLGACDAGVYVSSALNIQEKGSYSYKVEEIFPKKDFLEASIKKTPYQFPWEETFPGIILLKDKIVPQFFPLYSLHLSIFYKLFGLKGFLLCNLWFFFLAVLLFYKILNLFLPKFYSILSLILFTPNPGILYFLKYPTAEIFLTFFLLNFLFSFVIFERNKGVFFAFFSSLSFLLSLLIKFLPYFLIPVLLFYLIHKNFEKKYKYFIYFSLIFSLLPLCSILKYNYPYFLNHFLPIARIKYIFLLMLSLFFFYVFKNNIYFKNLIKILPLLFLFLSIWALFLRPNPSEILEENNLKEFSWYFGAFGTTLSFFGVFFSSFKKKHLLLCIIYYLFLILVLYGTGDNPLHPFSFRRYIPLFLPLSCFYFSYLLKIFNLNKLLCFLIIFISLSFPIYKGKNLILSKEGEGFLDLYFSALSKDIPKNTFATEDTFFLTSQWSLVGKKEIYPLSLEDGKSIEKFQSFLKKNTKFYLFSSSNIPFEKVYELEGKIGSLREERNRIPNIKEEINFKFFLYKYEKKEINPYSINFGIDDFGRVANFWDREFDGERYFKWSKRECFFYIKLKEYLNLLIDKGSNPENPLPFRIYYKNEILYEGFIGDGWNLQRIKIPENLKEKEVVLRFVTHSFQPLPDLRELGVKISLIYSN